MGSCTLAPTLPLDAGQSSRDEAKAVGRGAYRETLRPLDGLRNPAWDQQRAYPQLVGISIPGTGPDHRNHAVHRLLKMADDLTMPRPMICDRMGETIRFDAVAVPGLIEGILRNREKVGSATFTPT
jgi:hypothetical protein